MGWAIADHRSATRSGAVALIGWAVTTPADAYSTGQIAESVAQTSVMA